MKTEIMSGSSCLECLFFMSCSSWQKASRFWGDSSQLGERPRGEGHACLGCHSNISQALKKCSLNGPLTAPSGHPSQ